MSADYALSRLFCSEPELTYVTPQNTRQRRIQRSIHRHTDITELGFVFSGEGVYVCDGYSYPIYPGDFILYNQGSMHSVESSSELEIGTYFFGVSHLQLIGHPMGWMTDPKDSFVRPAGQHLPAVHGACQLIYEMIQRDTLESRITAQSYFLGILLTALQCPADARKEQRRDAVLAAHIQQYIALHFREPLTMQTIADDLNISVYYASHVFKQEFQISPIQFMIQCRIGEAQNLLISSNYSATEIAAMVGYDGANHFNAIFKKHVGMPPVQYRKHYLEQMRGKRKQ